MLKRREPSTVSGEAAGLPMPGHAGVVQDFWLISTSGDSMAMVLNTACADQLEEYKQNTAKTVTSNFVDGHVHKNYSNYHTAAMTATIHRITAA